jgi:hypothetical protein
VIVLSEAISLRLTLSAVAILGGIGLAIYRRQPVSKRQDSLAAVMQTSVRKR